MEIDRTEYIQKIYEENFSKNEELENIHLAKHFLHIDPKLSQKKWIVILSN